MRLPPPFRWPDDEVPPADLIPCGGSVGALFVVLLLRFVVGAGWWFLCGLS